MHIDIMTAQGWPNSGSISTASSVRPILREVYLAARRQHTHPSVGLVQGKDNKMVDAASHITHLTYMQFLFQFPTHFPLSKPWRLLHLTSGCKKQLTTMLHKKLLPRDSLSLSLIKTPPPRTNGGASVDGSKLPPITRTLRTPFPPSRFVLSTSVPAFCLCKGNLSRSERSSSTSAELVKSSHQWGPRTPDTTTWESSTFG